MRYEYEKEEWEEEEEQEEEISPRQVRAIDYTSNPCLLPDYLINFIIGAIVGSVILFAFYKIPLLSMVGALIAGIANIFMGIQRAKRKRLRNLRVQFYDLLEAMNVSLRAGNQLLKSLMSARKDLELIYSENSDIIIELDLILNQFRNNVPMSEGFNDFAQRCGLEDVESFASIYSTIEGKAERADEIVRETQQIISEKMRIEMEIETLMTAAKSEAMIMLFLAVFILLVIGYAGAGFMDSLYQPGVGRLVATGGLTVFIISYFLMRKFSDIEV